MVVRFDNFIETVRNHIEENIEFIHDNSKNSEALDNNIYKYFSLLKDKSYSYYSQILGLVASDHYKILYDKQKRSNISEEEQNMLNVYDDLYDNDSIVNFFEQNFELFEYALYEMSDFNSYDYFTKREILLNCKDELPKLGSFSFFNLFDYLYYCQKYSPELLKTIYKEYLNGGGSKKDAISSLISTLNQIYISDTDNYVEVISDLLVEYYKISKYQTQNDKHPIKYRKLNKTVRFLEKNDIVQILNKLNDDDVISEILKRIINFNDDVPYHINEIDDKTIKKLIQIKEIFK